MFQSRHQYLYLTSDALTGYSEGASGLEVFGQWPTMGAVTDPEVIAAFEAHVAAHAADRYYVITDLPAEGYHEESLPRLSARDERLLLRRRLEQQFRETRYRAVLPARRARAGGIGRLLRRRPETVTRVLSGMTSADALSPWLSALERNAVDVVSLTTVGALMGWLAQHLGVADRDALLVMRTGGGYRHTFTTAQGVRFSRLCADPGSAGDLHGVAQDIYRTLQYLTIGKQLKARADVPIPVILIDTEPEQDLPIPSLANLSIELESCRPADLVSAAPPALAAGHNAAWLLMNAAAFQGLCPGYAQDLPLAAAGRRAGIRRLSLAATAAGIAALVGYSAVAGMAATANDRRMAEAEQTLLRINAQTLATEQLQPALEVAPEQVRAVVMSHDRLMQRSLAADGLLRSVATALAPHPTLDIDRLEWSLHDAQAAGGTGARADANPGTIAASAIPPLTAVPPLTAPVPPLTASVPALTASVPSASSAVTPEPAAAPRVLHIEGHVGTPMGKAAANAAVNEFSRALAELLSGHAQVEHLPYDVSPQGTLTQRRDLPVTELPTYALTVRFTPASGSELH